MTEAVLLDKDEAATYLKVTRRMVDRLVYEKRIQFVKVGKYVRFRHEHLEAFIDAGTSPARGAVTRIGRRAS